MTTYIITPASWPINLLLPLSQLSRQSDPYKNISQIMFPLLLKTLQTFLISVLWKADILMMTYEDEHELVPHSLWPHLFLHSDFLGVPWTGQEHYCFKLFALTVSFALTLLPQDTFTVCLLLHLLETVKHSLTTSLLHWVVSKSR